MGREEPHATWSLSLWNGTSTERLTDGSADDINLHQAIVSGGNPSTATVTLREPAPADGALIAMESDQPELATVPRSITVPPGRTLAHFWMRTVPVDKPMAVTLAATGAHSTWSQVLQLTPPAPASLTVSPASVNGGEGATVTLQIPRDSRDGFRMGRSGSLRFRRRYSIGFLLPSPYHVELFQVVDGPGDQLRVRIIVECAEVGRAPQDQGAGAEDAGNLAHLQPECVAIAGRNVEEQLVDDPRLRGNNHRGWFAAPWASYCCGESVPDCGLDAP